MDVRERQLGEVLHLQHAILSEVIDQRIDELNLSAVHAGGIQKFREGFLGGMAIQPDQLADEYAQRFFRVDGLIIIGAIIHTAVLEQHLVQLLQIQRGDGNIALDALDGEVVFVRPERIAPSPGLTSNLSITASNTSAGIR